MLTLDPKTHPAEPFEERTFFLGNVSVEGVNAARLEVEDDGRYCPRRGLESVRGREGGRERGADADADADACTSEDMTTCCCCCCCCCCFGDCCALIDASPYTDTDVDDTDGNADSDDDGDGAAENGI